ncbi:MAG: CoA-binding protein [Armatimonadota bacterium]
MSNVAVLGASSNPDRYSYKAVALLKEYGHNVFPVHPSGIDVAGIKCYKTLSDIPESIDTITLYLSEKNSTPLLDEIISSKPKRIILNPGTESKNLKEICNENGINVIEACTLVMLRTNQF